MRNTSNPSAIPFNEPPGYFQNLFINNQIVKQKGSDGR